MGTNADRKEGRRGRTEIKAQVQNRELAMEAYGTRFGNSDVERGTRIQTPQSLIQVTPGHPDTFTLPVRVYNTFPPTMKDALEVSPLRLLTAGAFRLAPDADRAGDVARAGDAARPLLFLAAGTTMRAAFGLEQRQGVAGGSRGSECVRAGTYS